MIGFGDIKAMRRRVRRRMGAEDGVVTIEFVLWISMFIYLFLSSVEAGVMLTRSTMLDRAVDIAIRDVRLGIGGPFDHTVLVDRICSRTLVIHNCSAVLMLELRPISTTTWEPLNNNTQCVNRDAPVNPDPDQFETGGSNQMMLVRACAVVDPLFPTTGLGLQLRKDPSGGYHIVASSAFVNEPR